MPLQPNTNSHNYEARDPVTLKSPQGDLQFYILTLLHVNH